MNFKILAQFVMFAGLAVFAYGGYQYHRAGVEAEKQSASAQSMGYFGAVIAGMDANAHKTATKEEATKYMLIGGILSFVSFFCSAIAHLEKPKDQKSGKSGGFGKAKS